MNGYSSHTYKWYNDKGEYFWVQYHFKTDQGIKNLTREEAEKLSGTDPDHATRDLYEAIERGDYPSWTLEMQIMTPEQQKIIGLISWTLQRYGPTGIFHSSR